eukprot:5075413-Lingulodinium_polyedra.AAC.1
MVFARGARFAKMCCAATVERVAERIWPTFARETRLACAREPRTHANAVRTRTRTAFARERGSHARANAVR